MVPVVVTIDVDILLWTHVRGDGGGCPTRQPLAALVNWRVDRRHQHWWWVFNLCKTDLSLSKGLMRAKSFENNRVSTFAIQLGFDLAIGRTNDG